METTRKVESPLREWPGHIVIPTYLSAEQFNDWWRKANADGRDPKETSDITLMWHTRFHLVLDWKIEGLATSQIEETGMKLPDQRLATFVVAALDEVIKDAQDLKKMRSLLQPSANGKEAD